MYFPNEPSRRRRFTPIKLLLSFKKLLASIGRGETFPKRVRNPSPRPVNPNIGPEASLPDRVAWLEKLLVWVRRDSPADPLRLLLQILDHQSETGYRVSATLRSLVRETEALEFFTETGLPLATGFVREIYERLARRWLPRPPVSRESGDLFDQLFPVAADATWLGNLEPDLADRIATLWQQGRGPGQLAWESVGADLEDALILLAARVRVIGTSPAMRSRLFSRRFRDLPFLKLGPAVEVLVQLHTDGADVNSLAAEFNWTYRLSAISTFLPKVSGAGHRAKVVAVRYCDFESRKISVKPTTAATLPPINIQTALSVGDPVKNRETSD